MYDKTSQSLYGNSSNGVRSSNPVYGVIVYLNVELAFDSAYWTGSLRNPTESILNSKVN